MRTSFLDIQHENKINSENSRQTSLNTN